jgi:monothiol glutaredoxin
MERHILPLAKLHATVQPTVAGFQREVVDEVLQAAAENKVVVVGMKQNPYPRRARKALTEAGIAFRYLEYGSYFSNWRRRSALKFWTGWPTFPMVFVKGVLVGGAVDLQKIIDSGELAKMLQE